MSTEPSAAVRSSARAALAAFVYEQSASVPVEPSLLVFASPVPAPLPTAPPPREKSFVGGNNNTLGVSACALDAGAAPVVVPVVPLLLPHRP